MTRITNADHILVLLRSHLERAQRARTTGKIARRQVATQSAMTRLKSIASDDQVSKLAIKRALVAGVLGEEFGPAVASSPRFQNIVDEVLAMIERDEATATLLRDAVVQLTQND